MNKKTEKSAGAVNEELNIESSENSELSNEKDKPTISVESEDLDVENVEQTRVDVLGEIDEIVVVADTCTIVAPACDQPTVKKKVPDQDKIQPILIVIRVHEPEQKINEVYYKVFPLPNPCEMKNLWLYSSSFLWLLILLHYKTRPPVFSNKGSLMRTSKLKWGPRDMWVGPTRVILVVPKWGTYKAS